MAKTINDLEKALDSVVELLAHLKETDAGVSLSPKALEALTQSGGGPFTLADKQIQNRSGLVQN